MIKADAEKIIDDCGIETEDKHLNSNEIRFNGFGTDGHETFLITKVLGESFNFCKTARKPYDLLVGLVLARINYHAKGVLDISSDGTWEEWEDIREHYKALFGQDCKEFLK